MGGAITNREKLSDALRALKGDSAYAAGPYGLGVRVPLLVISPWSKGGWVSSEVFDHTSLIRFIQQRFGPEYGGLKEPNITAWRRALCGDLTSAFNFANPNDAAASLPSTIGYIPPDNQRHPDYVPVPPAVQALPVQERGTRPARPVPYELDVQGAANFSAGKFDISFANAGRSAAVLQVRTGDGVSGPWIYTVGSGARVSDVFAGASGSIYDLSVYGPNGFFRAYKGSLSGEDKANLSTSVRYGAREGGITLVIINQGASAAPLTISNAYNDEQIKRTLPAGQNLSRFWALANSYGWYDFTIDVESDTTFQQQLAGHVEDGQNSMTDPAIASVA